jgi:hypothetical protein
MAHSTGTMDYRRVAVNPPWMVPLLFPHTPISYPPLYPPFRIRYTHTEHVNPMSIL